MTQDELKQRVAREALKHVVEDSIVGVGSGSTVNFFIDALAGIKGRIEGTDGDNLVVDLFGQKIAMPKKRSHAVDNSIYAGIRPEKFRITLVGTPTRGNTLTGGRIEDVSYIGVSTQYQVMMPWGQEVMVFEQNDDGVAPFDKGDEVVISWEPNFTFALRGDEDAEAGTEVIPEDLDEE